MNNTLLMKLSAIILIVLSFHSCNFQKPNNSKDVKPAYDVLTRLIGDRAQDFVLELLPKPKGKDKYELEVKNNMVFIKATSNVALCYAAYSYMKNIGACLVSWEGNRVDLPEIWPDYSSKDVVTPFEYRMYMNPCVFGYTTVWWDWKRWEQELDWMALHGINMPVALEGQEAIWQKVYLGLGLSQKDLDEYFSGPAFLPWHRMGNISGHMGPLPQSWINKHADLQKNILNRMRELDMKPIVQAFSGYVPKKLGEKYPDAKIRAMKSWGGGFQGTYMLDPKDSLFAHIGKVFIKEHEKMYGPSGFFLADPFNEMLPPVSDDKKLEELAEYGEAVYKSITTGSPDGTWVMQGWLFGHSNDFWTHEAVTAFFSKIPDDKMMILDFGNDRYVTWDKHKAFYGKQWLYGFVHAYGGTNPVFGNMQYYNTCVWDSLLPIEHGNLKGFGVLTEGINNNSVVYEFIYDLPWGNTKIELADWIKSYCVARYGSCSPKMLEAWTLLEKAVYGTKYWKMRWWNGAGSYIHSKRPTLKMAELENHIGDYKKLGEAIKIMLSIAGGHKDNKLFVHDIIELTRHYVSIKTDIMLADACKAHLNGEKQKRDELADSALIIIEAMDPFIAAQDFNRLSTWLNGAVAMSENEKEKEIYLRNARTQISIWGGVSLKDYASKEWSGMYKTFYVPRWKLFFEEIRKSEASGKTFDEITVSNKIRTWEESWALQKDIPVTKPDAQPIKTAMKLIKMVNH